MDEAQFKERTKSLGLRIIRMVDTLPDKPSARVLGRQILRSATSVGANYRAACRAKSRADIINKLKIVEEEADETLFWLEMLIATNMVKHSQLEPLLDETNQIVAMTVASLKTLRASRQQS